MSARLDQVEIDDALLNAQQAELLNTTGAVDAAAFGFEVA